MELRDLFSVLDPWTWVVVHGLQCGPCCKVIKALSALDLTRPVVALEVSKSELDIHVGRVVL